jgi:heme exporter protein B
VSHLIAIVAKDLRSEARAKEIAPSMILFALVLVFLFTFTLPAGAGRAPVPPPLAGTVASREIAGVFLWATLLFAGIVGFSRNAALEREGGRLEALLLSPIDPAALFAGKAISNLIFLSVTEVVMIPAFLIFLDAPAGLLFPEIFVVLILANVGLAAVGTLFGAASQYSRIREVMFPLLAFPVLLPVVLGASRLTSTLLLNGSFAGEERWIVLLASFDLAITAVGAVTFEYVIQE